MDFLTDKVTNWLADFQEHARKHLTASKDKSFQTCFGYCKAELQHQFKDANLRSYLEEQCIILAAWQLAASMFPTVETPMLCFPGDYYTSEPFKLIYKDEK